MACLNGKHIAELSKGDVILPTSHGVKVFDIPKDSGSLNQEGQYADSSGTFHVLNR